MVMIIISNNDDDQGNRDNVFYFYYRLVQASNLIFERLFFISDICIFVKTHLLLHTDVFCISLG